MGRNDKNIEKITITFFSFINTSILVSKLVMISSSSNSFEDLLLLFFVFFFLVPVFFFLPLPFVVVVVVVLPLQTLPLILWVESSLLFAGVIFGICGITDFASNGLRFRGTKKK